MSELRDKLAVLHAKKRWEEQEETVKLEKWLETRSKAERASRIKFIEKATGAIVKQINSGKIPYVVIDKNQQPWVETCLDSLIIDSNQDVWEEFVSSFAEQGIGIRVKAKEFFLRSQGKVITVEPI